MKNILYIFAAALLCFCATSTHADLLDCNDKTLPSSSDLPVIGPKMGSSEDSTEHPVPDLFKNIGCQIKEGAENLGTELKEGAKELGEKAKDLGSDIKDKIGDLKDKFSSDSVDENTAFAQLRNV